MGAKDIWPRGHVYRPKPATQREKDALLRRLGRYAITGGPGRPRGSRNRDKALHYPPRDKAARKAHYEALIAKMNADFDSFLVRMEQGREEAREMGRKVAALKAEFNL